MGNNRAGQLGDGTWVDFRTTATTVLGLTSAEVVKIAAGGSGPTNGHELALLTDRTVQSWGANESGRLGDGSVFSHNAPGQVVNLSNATDIAAGGAHSLALLADGTVVAWGRNNYGQLGNGRAGGPPGRVRRGAFPSGSGVRGRRSRLARQRMAQC
ncbi:hypothetical protein [Embleya sp. NPDC005971]|uniref:RCC1 domain-containing protein n=1 Tax=Embleya sp. NPDC005971 TaxID=3156724 RepID=UPI0033E5312F